MTTRIAWMLALLAGLAVGMVGGFSLGIFYYPYLFLNDIVASERLDNASRVAVAAGEFVHANPSDPIHHGKGRVTVYRDLVHLGGDFEVGPGPRFHVYLVPDADVTTKTRVPGTRFVDLGRLRAFKGSQVFPLPAGIDPREYGSVVIWCQFFGVLISPARLQPLESRLTLLQERK